MEEAEKASWDLETEAAEKASGTWETEVHVAEKLPETSDWKKRKLDKLLMRTLARRQLLFFFIYNV
jgi:hypothetical protein